MGTRKKADGTGDMTIPAWAPAALVEQWRTRDEEDVPPPPSEDPFEIELVVPLINENIREEAIELLRKFITDERMERVWTNLSKRDKKKGRHDARAGVDIYFIAQAGISGWKLGPKLPNAERVQKMESIRDAAKNLAIELHRTPYPNLREISVSELMTDAEVLEFGQMMGGKLPAEDEKAIDWLRFKPMDMGLPGLTILLARLSHVAQREAERPQLVYQTQAEDARVHYFVRTVAAFICRSYGTPLHQTVATIASVALDEEITEQRVKDLVKTAPQDPFKDDEEFGVPVPETGGKESLKRAKDSP